MQVHAFAAQDAEAGEEELDRNSENEQPGQPDEDLGVTAPSSSFLHPPPRHELQRDLLRLARAPP